MQTRLNAYVNTALDVDIIYDTPNNETISDKTKSVRYNAALAIVDAVNKDDKQNCITSQVWGHYILQLVQTTLFTI